MRTLKTVVVMFGALSLSMPQAMAFVDAQALIGQRNATFETDNVSDEATGTEVNLSVHLDPIPLVPVSFGAYVALLDYQTDKDGDMAMKSLKGTEGGLELMAWLPMVPVITPYAKLGFPLYSAFKGDIRSADVVTGVESELAAVYKTSGLRLGVGAMWSPLPLLSVMAQVDFGTQKMKLEKLNDQKVSGAGTESDYKSTAFLLGVRVGI